MSARDPHDDVVDPIRHEAIAGRPMIVLTEGGLVGRVREALAVSGRLDALRVVHGKDALPEYLDYGPWSRRPYRVGGATQPDLAPLPPLDIAEALDGRHAIVVLGAPGSTAQAYAVALHDRAVAAARVAARGEPLLIFDKPDDNRMPECSRPGSGYALRVVTDGPNRIAVQGERTLVADAVDRAGGRRDAWLAGLDALDARHPGIEDGRFHVIEGGGRFVVAAPPRTGPADARLIGLPGRITAAQVYEIDPDGSCMGLRISSLAGEPADFGRLARLAWRGGLARLSPGNGDLTATSRAWTPHGGWPLMCALTDEDAAAAGRIKPLVDIELERALAHVRLAKPVVRLLRSDPARASRRRDFVITWPALSALLLDPATLAAVDAGGRTRPMIAKALGVRDAVARRLVGLRRIALDDGPLAPLRDVRLDSYGRLLSAVGHDRLPSAGDEEDWDAFHRLAQLAVGAFGLGPAIRETGIARLLVGIPGTTWPERCRVVIDPATGRTGLPEIQDLMRGLAVWLGRLADRDMPMAPSIAILSRHRSLLAVMRASNAWHAMPAMRDHRRGLPPDCRWPVPFDPVDLGDGWSAAALSSMAELAAEGLAGIDDAGVAGLDHCVGGYGPECQTGRSLVISLRRRTDEGVARISTAELVPTPGAWWIAGTPFHLRQHRGARNRDPGMEAHARLDRLRELLRDGEIPQRAEAVAVREPVALVHDRAGAAREIAGWRRLLPAPFDRMDAEALAREAVALAEPADADRR